jgi:NAD(P)-dependent dehydrogenase (short-subunit alcohol dehydrogenase family)
MAKLALITGGSRGLGRAAAEHVARAGTDVVITYRTGQKEAEQVVDRLVAGGRKAAAIRLDVGEIDALPGFAQELTGLIDARFGRKTIDYLVNNAGHGEHASFAETTEAQFDGLLNVHFKGVFFLTQALLPHIEHGGRILNVSTGLTRFSMPGFSAYAAMKGAVEVLTRYLAKELGPRGIAVNSVAPGGIVTDFGGGMLRDPELAKFVASVTSLGRVGEPDDVGALVAALLSEETRWVNAQRIESSGGMYV